MIRSTYAGDINKWPKKKCTKDNDSSHYCTNGNLLLRGEPVDWYLSEIWDMLRSFLALPLRSLAMQWIKLLLSGKTPSIGSYPVCRISEVNGYNHCMVAECLLFACTKCTHVWRSIFKALNEQDSRQFLVTTLSMLKLPQILREKMLCNATWQPIPPTHYLQISVMWAVWRTEDDSVPATNRETTSRQVAVKWWYRPRQ